MTIALVVIRAFLLFTLLHWGIADAVNVARGHNVNAISFAVPIAGLVLLLATYRVLG